MARTGAPFLSGELPERRLNAGELLSVTGQDSRFIA